jgi:hypothetical protein
MVITIVHDGASSVASVARIAPPVYVTTRIAHVMTVKIVLERDDFLMVCSFPSFCFCFKLG